MSLVKSGGLVIEQDISELAFRIEWLCSNSPFFFKNAKIRWDQSIKYSPIQLNGVTFGQLFCSRLAWNRHVREFVFFLTLFSEIRIYRIESV